MHFITIFDFWNWHGDHFQQADQYGDMVPGLLADLVESRVGHAPEDGPPVAAAPSALYSAAPTISAGGVMTVKVVCSPVTIR